MTTTNTPVTERLADHFVAYLFDNYQGSRHVRRVATWIGFLLKAVEQVAGGTLQRNRTRQVTFDYRGHRFKIRYNHQASRRGGIEIVEVLSGRGAPEGGTAVTIASLADAEDVYLHLSTQLDAFIDQ